MDRADQNSCTAIVLETELTAKKDRWKVTLQLIGGGVHICYPKLEEASALGLKVGKTVEDVELAYIEHSTGESERVNPKDGKVYKERFPLYRLKVELPRVPVNGAAAPKQ